MLKFQKELIGPDDLTNLNDFLSQSEDFYNMFNTCTLEDFRKVKEDKCDNLVYLFSYVSLSFLTTQSVKTLHDAATQLKVISTVEKRNVLRGAINVLTRIMPIVLEEKELLWAKVLWKEVPQFNNQINAIKLSEAISLLLFKPGFTINEYALEGYQPGYYCKYFI